MANTGYKIFKNRERQISTDGGLTWITDLTEPNTDASGNPVYSGSGPYIPPVYDVLLCPLPAPTTTTTTTTTTSTTTTTTTASPAPVSVSLTEQANPYADVNFQLKDNGADILDIYSTGTGNKTVPVGDTIQFQSTTTSESTGTNPLITLTIVNNGVTIYNQSTPAIPGASLLYSEVVTAGSSYVVTTSSSADVIPSEWIAQTSSQYCEQAITELATITNFYSPTLGFPIPSQNKIMYVDPTENGVIYFDPTIITDGSQATLIPIPSVPSSAGASRPTGAYYHAPTNKLYVNSFNGGGLTVIDTNLNTVVQTIPFGSNGAYSRGNIYYISALDQIWALGNSGYIRINASTGAAVTSSVPSGFTLTGAIFVGSINGKIYVYNDHSTNNITVYDTSLATIKTIPSLTVYTSDAGANVSRGYYVDFVNNKIYTGETSTHGAITVLDTISDTITNRVLLPNEGYSYSGPGVINFHPVRNTVYVGGAVYNNATTDSHARLWEFNVNTQTIVSTISPSVNNSISDIQYYSVNNSVYVSSAGLIPESGGANTAADGIIFKFN